MYRIRDSTSPILGPLFFIVLIIFGSFFALNLLLAVLASTFEEVKDKELQEKDDHVRRSSSSSQTSCGTMTM